MRIGIIGYGKMGREIEAVALKRGHSAISIDPNSDADFKDINAESLSQVDVCVDFTHPDVALANIRKVAALQKNIVVGTTGWYGDMNQVKRIVEKSGIGFIWSGNFSLGVNMFLKVIQLASSIIDKTPEYDVFGYEIHHNGKADSPSGTANMIAKLLTDSIKRKEKIVYDKLDRKIRPDEIHFASVRGGSVPGTHVVCFDSVFDTIELRHTARTRQGFALGAVLAAEFIKDKKGLFEIEDLMKSVL